MRFLLKNPVIYSLLQRLVGGREPFPVLILRAIIAKKAQELNRAPLVLDLGCGEGKYSKFLGEHCEYVGLDLSEQYISFANKKYGQYGKFYTYDISNQKFLSEFLNNREPDFIFMMGVIHHLTDTEFALVKKNLLDKYVKAAFFSLDGVFLDNQKLISRILLHLDRGNYVRRVDEYQNLFKNYNFMICHFTKMSYDYIFFYRHLRLSSLISEKFVMLKIKSISEGSEKS